MPWLFNPATPAANKVGSSYTPELSHLRDFYHQGGRPWPANQQFPSIYKVIVPPGTFIPLSGGQSNFRSNAMTINNTPIANCTVSAPAGITDGTILFYALCRGNEQGAITWPSGFTELWETDFNVTSNFACAWKRASGESGDYTASWTGTSSSVGCIYAIAGAVASGDPTTSGTTASGNGTSPDPPSVDPGSSDERLAIVVYSQAGAGATRFTPPAGYTEPAADSDGGTTGGEPDTHCSLGLAYRTYTGQVEDPGAATSSVEDEAWVANTIVLDPGDATPQTLGGDHYLRRRDSKLSQFGWVNQIFQVPRPVFSGVEWNNQLPLFTWQLKFRPDPIDLLPTGNNLTLRANSPQVLADPFFPEPPDVQYLPVVRNLIKPDYNALGRIEFEMTDDKNDQVLNPLALITLEPWYP